MEIIYFLVPISIVLVLIALFIFFWAVKNKQFEDFENASYQIIYDDKETRIKSNEH